MIAIKGMEEIPKSCEDCPLCNEYDYECGINGYDSKTDTAKERMKDCPLLEIVTCKDCKYNYENSCDFDGWGVNDDYFCAKGERKE